MLVGSVCWWFSECHKMPVCVMDQNEYCPRCEGLDSAKGSDRGSNRALSRFSTAMRDNSGFLLALEKPQTSELAATSAPSHSKAVPMFLFFFLYPNSVWPRLDLFCFVLWRPVSLEIENPFHSNWMAERLTFDGATLSLADYWVFAGPIV